VIEENETVEEINYGITRINRKDVKVDISNYDKLDSVFKKLGAVDCIVHLLPGRLDQQPFNY
jgi:hypothetical protein